VCVIFANICPKALISATQRYVRNWVGMWGFILIPLALLWTVCVRRRSRRALVAAGFRHP
jgi:hypothetical protein